MAYTSPAGDAANFTWVGSAAYTAPDGDAADFAWSPEGGTAYVQGLPALGTPGAIASQSISWAVGVPALGLPQSLIAVPIVALVQGLPALGEPSALLAQQIGWAIATPALGLPATLARTGFLAYVQGDPAAGLPQMLGTRGYTGILMGDAGAGDPQLLGFALPAFADAIPADITYYFATLTGAPDGLADVLLPISSFSVRHRPDGPSYYQIAIPSYAYIGAISARQNGEIVIWSRTGTAEEEVLRGDLGDVQSYRGPNSQTITVSGNSVRAETTAKTYRITEALYASTSLAGEYRLRIAPRAAIRPGDYIRYSDLNFQVGEVTWAVAVSTGGMSVTMEVASLPVDA